MTAVGGGETRWVLAGPARPEDLPAVVGACAYDKGETVTVLGGPWCDTARRDPSSTSRPMGYIGCTSGSPSMTRSRLRMTLNSPRLLYGCPQQTERRSRLKTMEQMARCRNSNRL